METLGMLGTLPPSSTNYIPYYKRHFDMPSPHIVKLGRMICNLIHCKQREIYPLINHYRPHTKKRSSNAYSCKSIFRYRNIKNTIISKLFHQVKTGSKNTLSIINSLPVNKY